MVTIKWLLQLFNLKVLLVKGESMSYLNWIKKLRFSRKTKKEIQYEKQKKPQYMFDIYCESVIL